VEENGTGASARPFFRDHAEFEMAGARAAEPSGIATPKAHLQRAPSTAVIRPLPSNSRARLWRHFGETSSPIRASAFVRLKSKFMLGTLLDDVV
jgi:hypothetical protein